MRIKLLLLSIISLSLFVIYSYSVAKEKFTQSDFDTTVKIQDRIPKNLDDNLSLLSLLGSVEVTFGIAALLALLALLRWKLAATLGWSLIIPATVIEVLGKLLIFHPGPPVLFHRTTLVTHLPSFYVHTDFSYPSGHMTRTAFIITTLCCVLFFYKINFLFKSLVILGLLSLGFLMVLTRISLGEHWFSDVFGGGLLGVGFGFLAAFLILKRRNIATVSHKM